MYIRCMYIGFVRCVSERTEQLKLQIQTGKNTSSPTGIIRLDAEVLSLPSFGAARHIYMSGTLSIMYMNTMYMVRMFL